MERHIEAIKTYREAINQEIDSLIKTMQRIVYNDNMKVSIEGYLLDLDDLKIETTLFKSVLLSDAVAECNWNVLSGI